MSEINQSTKQVQKETISTGEAARLLGCNPEAVRQRIRVGVWKFGEVIPKGKTGKKTDSFVIYRRKLFKHLGMEGGEENK